jgi:hypothetical protein
MNKTGFVPFIKESEIKEGKMKPCASRAGLFCWYGKAGKFLEYQTVARIWVSFKLLS